MDEIFEGLILPILLVGFPIILIILFFAYHSSCVSARIYNQQNGTQYTCGDFLWASNQINSQTSTIKLK